MNPVRLSGLLKLLLWGTVAAAYTFVAQRLALQNRTIYGLGWGVPGALALAGLVQFISGVHFSELSSRWNELQGWQRGLLGTLIIAVACGAIFGVMAFILVTFFS